MNPDIAHWHSAGPLISHLFFKGRGRGRGNLIHLIPEVCKGRKFKICFWLKETFHTLPNQKLLSIFNTFSLKKEKKKYVLGYCASFLPALKFFHWSFGFVSFFPLSLPVLQFIRWNKNKLFPVPKSLLLPQDKGGTAPFLFSSLQLIYYQSKVGWASAIPCQAGCSPIMPSQSKWQRMA